MQLHAAQRTLSARPTRCFGTVVVVVPVVTPNWALAPPTRKVVTRSSKATSLGWDDLANALPRANPEKRVLQDINFFQLVRECPDWESLQRMESDLRDRYDRQPSLAMAVLLRASEVVDVESASEAERKAVAKLFNSSIAPFIISKGVYSYKPTALPSLLAALAALQYRNGRLNAVLLRLLESSVDALMLTPLCSALCSAASLEWRMEPELLAKVMERLDYTIRFCTAEDVGNLATALAPYNKLPSSASLSLLSRLAALSQPFLEQLSGEQLVDLLALFVKQDFPLTNTWVSSFQTALLAGLPLLTRPRSYTTLLFSLAKGDLAISEGFLSALLERLAAPRGSNGSSLLARMRPSDLAVVAAVLSIYGYTPPEPWCEQYLEAVERRAGDMDAKQVVTIVDTCVELGMPLSGDLLDELLAVAEGGLAELPPTRLQQLLAALQEAGHQPDGPWLRCLSGALGAAAGRATAPQLVDIVAVLPFAPYAYPPDGESTAAVLAAVKARAAELEGLDAATRGSVKEALEGMKHPGAAAFADSLAPPPPPPPTPAPAPKSTTATKRSAAATSASGRAATTGTASSSRAAATGATAAAPAARAAVPAPPAPAAAAAVARSRQPVAAPPPPPPMRQQLPSLLQQQQQQQDALVGSTRSFRRRMSSFDDEEEDEQEDEEDEEEEVVARSVPSGRAAAAAAQRAPPPPPPPPPAFAGGGGGDGGFVTSTRTSRRR